MRAYARWLDGRAFAPRTPLPALDGPGVFETVRCERGELAFLDAHLARLERGARALGLRWPPPWPPGGALQDVARSIHEARALRLAWAPPHLLIVARPIDPSPEGAPALLAEPGSLAPPLPAGVKTIARAAYDARRAEAHAHGAFEVLVLARNGELVEGTISNVFVAKEGVLATPPLGTGALPGIVRGALLAGLSRRPLVDSWGRTWTVAERTLARADLERAGEVLLTNSVQRVVGLARLAGLRDDLPGSYGPVASALLARVLELEREASPR